MSFELILPFFPDELRALLLDPSISDLMINGATGVFADRGGVVERITLSTPYTNDRLQAAIERVARLIRFGHVPGGEVRSHLTLRWGSGEQARRRHQRCADGKTDVHSKQQGEHGNDYDPSPHSGK